MLVLGGCRADSTKPEAQVIPGNPVRATAFVSERLDIGKDYPIEATRLFMQPIEVINFLELE